MLEVLAWQDRGHAGAQFGIFHTKEIDMTTTSYTVSGMTCSHCVAAVTEEVMKLDGVAEVQIALVEGGESQVSVVSAAPLTDAAVRAAVDEAGYELVGASA
ncbi:heavy-metal-associated domain-containing protein [Pengzhenrongella phosphoraccumulans]|uniref:heavy-metal-associated domain-containing protein n=1 Tax=Pengzhenrongella phosphoraccumulans TaxID=3114394 RepID=UPI00388D230B